MGHIINFHTQNFLQLLTFNFIHIDIYFDTVKGSFLWFDLGAIMNQAAVSIFMKIIFYGHALLLLLEKFLGNGVGIFFNIGRIWDTIFQKQICHFTPIGEKITVASP